MALFFYNLFINAYRIFIHLMVPFHKKAGRFVGGRRGLFRRLTKDLREVKGPVVWFHCASLGEFEQGKPVMEAFRKQYPSHTILATFFSPSGYEPGKKHSAADLVHYLPFDTLKNASRFFLIVNPSLIFFIKYEFWYHYLNQARKRRIPLYCIAALFTQGQPFFKGYGALYQNMLSFFSHLFVQDEGSIALLKTIGMTHASVSGDTRFDRVLQTREAPERYPLVEKFKGDKLLMVIGSSWPEDMLLLNPIINTEATRIKFIIAPHRVHEAGIRRLEKKLKKRTVRITEATEKNIASAEVLIINTIGMLSSLYQYGDLAYIGGAFGKGLHNTLEAAAFGLPVIFGNRGLHKFPESLELEALGGAFPIAQASELREVFEALVSDRSSRAKASAVCQRFITTRAGATGKIMDYLNQHYEG